MIVVTGGAGFIGSNLVHALNAAGHDRIIVVDDLTDGTKFRNLADCAIADYLDKDDFLARVNWLMRKTGTSSSSMISSVDLFRKNLYLRSSKDLKHL